MHTPGNLESEISNLSSRICPSVAHNQSRGRMRTFVPCKPFELNGRSAAARWPSRPALSPSWPADRSRCSTAISVVFGAVVRAKPREGIDFFPLQVDYRERRAAAGKFPGGFMKREGRPTNKEILTARLIDRPLRPLFPKGFMDEVQIHLNVLAFDGENDPDIFAGIAASAAVAISDIPFTHPDGPRPRRPGRRKARPESHRRAA